jgi:Rrf2 family protein
MSKIVKISEAASLALHAVVLLAENGGQPLSAGALSARLKASAFHLSKVLQRLAKAGFIVSTRGPRGGFLLNRRPDSISLRDIYEAIEGPMTTDTCLFQKPVCDGKQCLLGGLLDHVNQEVKSHLEKTFISDLKGLIPSLTDHHSNQALLNQKEERS